MNVMGATATTARSTRPALRDALAVAGPSSVMIWLMFWFVRMSSTTAPKSNVLADGDKDDDMVDASFRVGIATSWTVLLIDGMERLRTVALSSPW